MLEQPVTEGQVGPAAATLSSEDERARMPRDQSSHLITSGFL